MPLHQEPGQKPSQPGKGWPGLPGKCGLVKPTKHGHSQAFLATLAAKAWPSWPCYFRGRAFSATLVIKARPNPGLNYSSQAWPGFFEFPGQKFITLRDCNMNISFSVFGPGQPLPGQARAGPVAMAFRVLFYRLANMAKARPQARLTPAFRPGFHPGLAGFLMQG